MEYYPNNYRYDGYFKFDRRDNIGIMNFDGGISYIGEWN